MAQEKRGYGKKKKTEQEYKYINNENAMK